MTTDPRVRVLNDAPPNPRGEFVLYFCQAYRRAEDNAALDTAIREANARGLPCLFYEAVRPDYPYASDRLHAFLLQCARDSAEACARRGIAHALFLPRSPDEARGVLARTAARAALVVSDAFPSFIAPAQNAALAKRAPCTYLTVDDNTPFPLALFPRAEHAARTLRPKVTKARAAWLAPLDEPSPSAPPARLELPFEPTDPARLDLEATLAALPIDHSVRPVADLPGGSRAAAARLERFLRSGLASYAVDRNDPSREGTSGLSAHLHFGAISARRVALAAIERGGDGVEPFLEQLLVRRTLAFNFAAETADHTAYTALPAWARAALASRAAPAHGEDDDAVIARMNAATTDDELWNAAQLELRARGRIQSYARMLWGKLPIAWLRDPARAHAWLVRENDRYALDGRDPDGYANIGWCFGLHDRPWPARPGFGKVRAMTSRSARAKLDFEGYISRARAWRAEL